MHINQTFYLSEEFTVIPIIIWCLQKLGETNFDTEKFKLKKLKFSSLMNRTKLKSQIRWRIWEHRDKRVNI